MEWFRLVGFKILIGRIHFLHDQILDFQNFVGDSHVRSASPATQILSYAVYLCSVIIPYHSLEQYTLIIIIFDDDIVP